MRRFFKAVLICLIVCIGLASGLLIADVMIMETRLGQPDMIWYHDLLGPFSLLILSIPAALFNIRSFNILSEFYPDENPLLDADLIRGFRVSPVVPELSKILWVGNFLFGALIICIGIYFYSIVLKSFPLNELPEGFLQYSLIAAWILIGVWIIAEEIRLKRMASVLKR